MELSVNVMNKSETMYSILMFQTDRASMYWRKPLFRMYPFLDEKRGLKASWKNRKKYLMKTMSDYYDDVQDELYNKARVFYNHWVVNKEDIIRVFTKAFNMDCSLLFDSMIAEVSLNPICPRNITDNSFTVFYKSDENRFLETALHEIIHFVWFHIWQKHFKDSSEDYEGPHLKWILSEMVVDTFVNNTEIGQLFSQSSKENVVYQYFYTMKINNKLILETLSQLYRNSVNITQFMEQAYNYCQDNEQDIRKQML